ncbi:substrate-binding domain-containing protein [Bradyrhizobium sp. LA6.7]|uniref:substrate-binding domain-containing protein n=1 Tax=unclassified Bradyrhizobium TaxID=2631580 RepID=UPI003393D086
MRVITTTAAATIGIALLSLLMDTARAGEIQAIVSGALTGAFRELTPEYERASGDKVVIAWGPSSGTTRDAIPVRIANGEPVDVLIMVGPALDGLITQGKFRPESRVEIAKSRIGLGVRSGASKPDVGSVDAFKHALLQAKSIGYSEGASGVYISTELLKKLGIADEVASKAKKITGELVGEAVARGEVEIGLQQISELIAVNGVDFVGPLPEEIQKASPIVVAISATAKDPKAARSFVSFLSSAPAALLLAKSGLDAVATSK